MYFAKLVSILKTVGAGVAVPKSKYSYNKYKVEDYKKYYQPFIMRAYLVF